MAEDYEGWKTVDLNAYDDEVISKAFWLQEHIRRYGIDGIYFTRRARNVAVQEGPDTVANFIEAELRKL